MAVGPMGRSQETLNPRFPVGRGDGESGSYDEEQGYMMIEEQGHKEESLDFL